MKSKGAWILSATFISAIGTAYISRLIQSPQREAELDSYLEAGAPPLETVASETTTSKSPPFDMPTNENGTSSRQRQNTTDFWERSDSSCLHVDYICSYDGSWFYAPPIHQGAHTTAHQPTVKLKIDKEELASSHGHDLKIEERIQFFVKAKPKKTKYNDAICSYSPASHHMVIHSAWSEMMGEFYSRAILPLNQWLRDYPISANDDIQLYLHSLDKRKQTLFEGHQLFMGGLPNNNNQFDSFLSMMPKNDTCQCYQKLILCGYDVSKATNTSMLLRPKAAIANPAVTCTAKTSGDAFKHCTSYRKLRRDLISTYVTKEPLLDTKIEKYREGILMKRGLITNSTESVSDWKFVGLAQRKSRRKWLNVEEIIKMCDDKFRSFKIVCFTVDVEETSSALEQLLMHRSLHAFIGVHGAQLTQGVLLPKHGYVLELLPWVPYYLWGVWVTTTHIPTPLGLIYHNTDLNHVGYPLGRDSVPLCLHVDPSNEEEDRECLMNKTNNKLFRWADRDFNVPYRVIGNFLHSFLVKESDICNNMQARALEGNFVLYNALCRRNGNETKYQSEHYYREKDESKPLNHHEPGGSRYAYDKQKTIRSKSSKQSKVKQA